MQLVQVDAIGLQALEALVQRRDDVLAVVLELAIADVADAVAGAGNLAGQHPVITVTVGPEPVADDALGSGVGFRAWGHRVHFGRVDEVDPRGLGPGNLAESLFLVVLLAPGHGAQAQGADVEVGSAELAVFHRVNTPWQWKLIKAG